MIEFSIAPVFNGYPAAKTNELLQRSVESLQALPGVADVSFTSSPVMTGAEWFSTVSVDGYRERSNEDMDPLRSTVGPRFFHTLGIPLVAGRDFTFADGATTRRVAIVNERFAEYFYKGENPIGRIIRYGGRDGAPVEIVGVVKNNRHVHPREEFKRQVWVPFQQDRNLTGVCFYVRASADPEAVLPAIRKAMRAVDPNLPLDRVGTMPETLDREIGRAHV